MILLPVRKTTVRRSEVHQYGFEKNDDKEDVFETQTIFAFRKKS